jgi:transposase
MQSGSSPLYLEEIMRPQTYRVELSEEDRVRLLMLTRQGTASAQVIRRAHTLLLASEGAPDHAVAAALHANRTTVQRTRRRFCTEGLDAALYDRPRPGAEPKLDARGEAFLVALACSAPPKDQERWTMQMLADRLVAAGLVEEISDETVRRRLGKKQAQAVAD